MSSAMLEDLPCVLRAQAASLRDYLVEEAPSGAASLLAQAQTQAGRQAQEEVLLLLSTIAGHMAYPGRASALAGISQAKEALRDRVSVAPELRPLIALYANKVELDAVNPSLSPEEVARQHAALCEILAPLASLPTRRLKP